MSLIARLKGEEPSLIAYAAHALTDSKGDFGEWLTDYALSHENLPGRLVTFDNLILPYHGRTTEIDVLMLHERGIYVFESKNYSGQIYGSLDRRQWTQVLKGGAKERFGNPVTQNRGHIRALAEMLDLPLDAFRSYVVFSERCELKKVPDDTLDSIVCQRQHLLQKVRHDLGGRLRVFDEREFDEMRRRIQHIRDTQPSKEVHVENVQRMLAGEICPRCGAKLVERNGKHGRFLGCSNFPKCRFTRDLVE